MAQAILANLLASAQATTLECRRVNIVRTHAPSPVLPVQVEVVLAKVNAD